MTTYLRPVDAQRCRPACTRCGWIGEPQTDRKAAAAAYEHDQTCQAVPTEDENECPDGGL